MGINFKVAMILEATNRMDGGIRGAMNSVGRLKRSFADTARETSRLNPVGGWAAKIAAVSKQMDDFGKKAQSIRDKAEKQMMDGMKGIAAGGAIAAPMIGGIKQAANLQTRFTTMGVMGMSDEGKAKVKEQSVEYAKMLAFDIDQVVGVAQALQKAGMNEAKTLQAQKIATNYAQLEYNRYGADPNQTATHLAHIAESAGVLYVTAAEKEKYSLKTQEAIDRHVVGKFGKMAETLNKVVSVTSSDTARLAESIKYSMPTAKALGWSDESAMLMSGIYSRFGIEGSMSGTHLKDFAARLNPYQHYIGEDVAKKSNRLTAMQEAGWLEGAQWVTTKNGQKKFLSAGKSVFHNDDGTLKVPEQIFAKIHEAYERFNNQGKRLQFEGILHDVLGEQGKDIAQLLNQNPEMFKHITKDMEKVMSMEKGLAAYQNDVNTQWDIFTGNIKTASILLGDTVLGDVAGTLKGWNETLFGDEKTKSPVGTWIGEHKELVGWIVKGTLVVAGLVAGVGVLKIITAGLNFALVAPFMTCVGWIGKTGIKLSGLRDGFKYFRGKGGGFFESIWKGAQFALPWLGKLTGWVRTFTPFWLTNAARIAAGWLVALGPVGWIILGVTAVIAGAVAAWNTNFLGFRDKATEVWAWIKDYADFICPGISKAFDEMASGIVNNWTWAKNRASDALDAMSNEVKWVCNAMGIDFDGVTAKVGNFIQKLWDSQLAVVAYKKITGHFDEFDRWRERGKNMGERDLLGMKEYILPKLDGTAGDFYQTNNITVPNVDLATEFVRKSPPSQKYSLANPQFNLSR